MHIFFGGEVQAELLLQIPWNFEFCKKKWTLKGGASRLFLFDYLLIQNRSSLGIKEGIKK
jgi:hypothetical protein